MLTKFFLHDNNHVCRHRWEQACRILFRTLGIHHKTDEISFFPLSVDAVRDPNYVSRCHHAQVQNSAHPSAYAFKIHFIRL